MHLISRTNTQRVQNLNCRFHQRCVLAKIINAIYMQHSINCFGNYYNWGVRIGKSQIHSCGREHEYKYPYEG